MPGGVHHYQDLIAWQKARALTRDVYFTTSSAKWSRDLALRSQGQRAAVSIMANTAEGFERRRSREFGRFLDIARSSCAELGSHLYVALDIGYVDEPTFERLLAATQEVGRILSGLRTSLRSDPPPS